MVWVVIVAARQLFVYGAQHWFTMALGRFLASNHISVDALADSIMVLALAPVVANRLAILLRARSVAAGGHGPEPVGATAA